LYKISNYYEALGLCFNRYYKLALTTFDDDHEIVKFLEEFYDGILDKLPLCKLNRWLGYIQRYLIEKEITTVEAERDWTRPLFRPLDFDNE
jgi:hypothetical protein